MGMMRRKLPPNVERNVVKGHVYLSFRIGKGPRIKLPADPTSEEFRTAYAEAMGKAAQTPTPAKVAERTIGALIIRYLASTGFKTLRDTSKQGYRSRFDKMRKEHGHRSVSGLTKERIQTHILDPLADTPGAALDTLKKLRILIRHARDIEWLNTDPSDGIKRPKSKEIRSWTDTECKAFEKRWKVGTRQRAAYELMLNVGTARADVHRVTWTQFDEDNFEYSRQKTGVEVAMTMAKRCRDAVYALPRKHVTVLNTEFGRPFTVDGFSGFMRDAIKEAGLPLDCRPHGLRKTLGRRLADRGVSAHDIMAALGHTTLSEAERYTREADRRRGGRRAGKALDDQTENKTPQTSPVSLGKSRKAV